MGFSDILASLTDNPYFSAGFGLVGVGSGLAVLRKGAQAGFVLFRRHCMITLEVSNKDKSFDWVMQWMTQNKKNHMQHLSVSTLFHQHDSGKITTHFNYNPSPGAHFIGYKNHWFRVERQRDNGMRDLATGIPWETITFTSVGRSKAIFTDILNESKELAISKQTGKTLMYIPMGAEWRQFGFPRQKRPLDSVILDENISEEIVADIMDFIKNQAWYTRRGIPYRRGYLLHGPPGCGKSSFIMALAGELQYNICVMNLGDRTLSDDRLNHLMSVAPQQSIILLEDIDAAFSRRDIVDGNKDGGERGYYPNHVTFSGLLNCLDGVASTEERLVFMTTNHIDRLDPALIRPGRIDVKKEIGHATPHQLYLMFRRFYPECSHDAAVRFSEDASKMKDDISVAQIQGYFLLHKNSELDALKNVHLLGE
eukprot:TCONS_00006287-protein